MLRPIATIAYLALAVVLGLAMGLDALLRGPGAGEAED